MAGGGVVKEHGRAIGDTPNHAERQNAIHDETSDRRCTPHLCT
jgi:hypothetical protein